LDFRSRVIVALLAGSLALSGTGVPCLLACAVEAAHEHEHAAPCHDADTSDVLCSSDPAPAILAQAFGTTTLPDLGIVLPAALHPGTGSAVAYARAAIKLPDRSPPVPPGFVVLRI
jgi:hypothetical protein